MEEWQIKFLKNKDITLRVASFNLTEKTDHVIVIANGRSEHIEKYFHIPSLLKVKKSCAFITLDHRGQGKSEGKPFHIDSYDEFVDDLKFVIHELAPNAPYMIVAHSMGGLISLYGTYKKSLQPKALALCAPFIGFPKKELPIPILSFFIKLGIFIGLKHLRFNSDVLTDKFETNLLTSSEKRYKELVVSSFKSLGPTLQWIMASEKAMRSIFSIKNNELFSMPILFQSAWDEQVVGLNKGLEFMEKLSKLKHPKAEAVIHSHGRHELLFDSNENERKVLEKIEKLYETVFS